MSEFDAKCCDSMRKKTYKTLRRSLILAVSVPRLIQTVARRKPIATYIATESK